MASLTAVELGADICALARTSVHRDDVQLLAAETIDPAAFPGIASLAVAIRQIRRSMHLPRRSRAVIWGLPDGASREDPTVTPLLAPLVGAGFKVERIVSPCNALAALGRLRTARQGATCWLAINRGGVAIVAVRPGEQLYAHSFVWDSALGAIGSQARLLQRYSLVSHLAPEIRRAMAAAREKGSAVEAVVTCGNLPDLRSMTMPLIEELDVEVETLDSLDGLNVKPAAAERLSELAPSLRMACAGAIARVSRTYDPSKLRSKSAAATLIPASAAIAGLVYVGWAWYSKLDEVGPNPAVPVVNMRGAAPAPTPPVLRAPAKKPESKPQVSRVEGRGSTVAPHTGARPSLPESRPPLAVSVPAKKPAQPAPVVSAPARKPEPMPVDIVQASKPLPSTVGLNAPGARTDKPDAGKAPRPLAEPLKDPIPRVTGILVSNERRLATIDEGNIITVGDTVGKRLVVRIDERYVVFRELSGVQIRVALGGRVVGIDRPER
jgi:hypothetical protein